MVASEDLGEFRLNRRPAEDPPAAVTRRLALHRTHATRCSTRSSTGPTPSSSARRSFRCASSARGRASEAVRGPSAHRPSSPARVDPILRPTGCSARTDTLTSDLTLVLAGRPAPRLPQDPSRPPLHEYAQPGPIGPQSKQRADLSTACLCTRSRLHVALHRRQRRHHQRRLPHGPRTFTRPAAGPTDTSGRR